MVDLRLSWSNAFKFNIDLYLTLRPLQIHIIGILEIFIIIFYEVVITCVLCNSLAAVE